MTPVQQAAIALAFGDFARSVRLLSIHDQALAEWLLDLSARWLAAHGVSESSLHQWITYALGRSRPVPLTAAARAPSEFGVRR